jgi:CheY-like chemotaxis protein
MQSAITSCSSHDGIVAGRTETRILLVEDSASVRVRLVELLTEPGVMRVTATAESEANALQLIDEQDFEVLVVDVELRPGSGISVVRHARAHWRGEFRPTIIVLTNFSLPTVRDRCIAAGADYFLDKMRQFDQVHQIIRHRAA